jgi:hypothetical protein
MRFTRFGGFNDDPNFERTLEYSSNDGHKNKANNWFIGAILSLTPLSESIMMCPSCMA